MTPPHEPGPLRRHLYALLIVAAAAMALGRILNAELVYEPSLHRVEGDPAEVHLRRWPDKRPEPMPTFSSNDRSRWCTVRALVDEGTYVIGHRDPSKKTAKNKYGDHGIVFEDGWGTVDKVMKPGTDEFYSSKPPLLSTLMAGEYWLLKKALGWSITERPFPVVRVIVLTFNWLPWVVYLVLLARLAERLGATDFGKLYIVAAGAFATLMTPFLISINNHTLAACSALVSLYLAERAWRSALPGALVLAGAGFFAGFTACNELPAAAFAAGLGIALLWRWPARTRLFFVPAGLVPVAAYLLVNYLAVGSVVPVQAQDVDSAWYRYEGSHWLAPPREIKPGIDFADTKEDRATYAFHVLFGHHGVFSLTPIFLLAVAGMAWGVYRLAGGGREPPEGPGRESGPTVAGLARVQPGTTLNSGESSYAFAGFAAFTVVLSVLVVGFYLVKTINYGGWTAGPRWLLWLTPLWLLTLLPVADRLGRSRGGRVLLYLLLGLSVLSASYPAWNPWRHPWIYTFMESQGLIPY
jgi:hypothetical protein